MTVEARWNGETIARSDDTIVIEGNHYFPPSSVNRGNLVHSETSTHCPWKGDASYFHVNAGGEMNRDAAWTYTEPFEKAAQIRDYIAFWNGVDVIQT
ncbi:DUF427 domain-containing protein [Qipengyuania sp. JC766]|uniref:DUF427 domain-containing protein n=1 Tax=Qipengyuania sp. JC766 TaxID=3232139 RepID=UPI0034590189